MSPANNYDWRKNLKRLVVSCVLWVIVSGLWGCSDRIETSLPTPSTSDKFPVSIAGLKQLKEVAPPATIQQLHQILERKQPQVTILNPQADQVLTETKVSVKLQVKDLPIFQDKEFKLGPHLEVIVDNQEAQSVYDLEKPLVFSDLAAGSHTLRVFASYPWHESFKNEGAYAQATFHVFTKTINNKLDPKLPLLTYSTPAGSYEAEPILLDFYLTNAPLHMIAQEDGGDEIADWRIRVTINGETFVLDQWQPIYLKGWQAGNNWVQLEFIDEQGNVVENAYNNTAKVFTYKPGGKDSLSKLIRGELSVAAAKGIINPEYDRPALTPTLTPQLTPSPKPIPSSALSPVPLVPATPKVKVLEEGKPISIPETREKAEIKVNPPVGSSIKPAIASPPSTKSVPEVATPQTRIKPDPKVSPRSE